MNDPKIKQQIVEKVKDSSNILVTVSNSPSVDELSAALGLTLLLNKMDKHATAVFSGAIPPAINFLDPEKTFEGTTDSLRDFIIALDKEKADHLRYKLDGDMVKIFITPYRTTITGDDLEFSQGDFNVELVLALGVENKDHLDGALQAHGRILHDATVVTLSAGEQLSKLGSLDWRDENASSLSEMLVSLVEALKSDKPLLDGAIATAFLTGIVAATDRFSNTRTSSRAMTMAAQLMAAGADQQLIAAKLEESHEIGATKPEQSDETPDEGVLTEGKSTKVSKKRQDKKTPPKKNDGELSINHEKTGTIDEVAKESQQERLAEAEAVAQQALQDTTTPATPEPAPDSAPAPAPSTQSAPEPTVPTGESPATPLESPRGAVSWKPAATQPSSADDATSTSEPSFGGTLNATTEQAEEVKRRELAKDQNKTILTHNARIIEDGEKPTYDAPLNGALDSDNDGQSVDIFADNTPPSTVASEPPAAPTVQVDPVMPPSTPDEATLPTSLPSVDSSPQSTQPVTEPSASATIPAPPTQTLADIDLQNRSTPSHQEAMAAVDAALSSTPPPVPPPFDLPLPPPPPDFSALPPNPSDFSGTQPLSPERLGDIFAPAPSAPDAQPSTQGPTDPGQFRIPGQ